VGRQGLLRVSVHGPIRQGKASIIALKRLDHIELSMGLHMKGGQVLGARQFMSKPAHACKL